MHQKGCSYITSPMLRPGERGQEGCPILLKDVLYKISISFSNLWLITSFKEIRKDKEEEVRRKDDKKETKPAEWITREERREEGMKLYLRCIGKVTILQLR